MPKLPAPKRSKKQKPKNTGNPGLIMRLVEYKLKVLDMAAPFATIPLRIYIALVFWRSGLTKFTDFDSAIFLFENEYKTHEKLTLFGAQILTPEMAAYLGTFAELFFPILLIIGFASRFAALSLLVMTAVIEFTYQSHSQHITWAVMLSVIFLQGAGRGSWDYFIRGTVFGETDDTDVREKLLATFATLCLTLFAAFLIFNDIVRTEEVKPANKTLISSLIDL